MYEERFKRDKHKCLNFSIIFLGEVHLDNPRDLKMNISVRSIEREWKTRKLRFTNEDSSIEILNHSQNAKNKELGVISCDHR